MGGARALGLDDLIGTLEPGKEADMIAVDPRLVAPVEGMDSDDPAEIMSRLAFRPHPDMVRLAWVRGRSLEGPPGFAPA
jgi:5-methylthioadenosine/S-adenosylhomocysteine deaminase